jgi:hypothetical protein
MLSPFIINLDEEPNKRYAELVKNFNIKKISKIFYDLYNSLKPNIIGFDALLSNLIKCHTNKIMYYDELVYWSKLFEIDLFKVIVMQLIYEINSGCTTFVVPIDNIPTMFRTMDWSMEFLKDITYQAIFYKNNEPIYEGVCWLGSVGIFTAKSIKYNYSLAINYRRINNFSLSQIYTNYLNAINMNWPVSYLTRYLLENNYDFEQTLHNLSNALLISPVYYIINNFNGKGALIRRTPNTCEVKQKNIIIQTNCDNEVSEPNIMYSHERIKKLKNTLKQKEYNFFTINSIMQIFPIKNYDTIYLSVVNKEKFNTEIFPPL